MYDKRYPGRRDFKLNEDLIRQAVEKRTPTDCDVCRYPKDVCELSNPAMPSLAMVYTPYQCFTELYTEEKGFSRGTIFVQLDKPFTPCSNGGMRGGNCNGCKM